VAKPVSSCLIHACSSAGLSMALIHSGQFLFTVERYSASSRIYPSTKPCQSSRKLLQQRDQCRIVSIVRRYVERETSVSNGSGTMPFSAQWCIERVRDYALLRAMVYRTEQHSRKRAAEGGRTSCLQTSHDVRPIASPPTFVWPYPASSSPRSTSRHCYID
jgi:hypothetical protein